MDTFALSVATTPDGLICDSCFEAASAMSLSVRRIVVTEDELSLCDYCGDPIHLDLGLLTPEDLDY
jgi:hypothetical protein